MREWLIVALSIGALRDARDGGALFIGSPDNNASEPSSAENANGTTDGGPA